jgi:hypothetical protein
VIVGASASVFKASPERTAMLLNFLERLPLPELFLACLVCGAVVLIIVLAGARLTLRACGISATQPLFVRDALISALSAMFAIMVAFAAAGIWNDAVQARAAVQREANAIENIVALSSSYPLELREEVHSKMLRYARRVLDSDWPAMQRRTDLNENLYDRSNSPLVALMTRLSNDAASRTPRLPLSDALVGQIVDLRSARLQREMIARGGVSPAQWLAMLLIATGALTVIALAHNSEFGMRTTAASIYVIAVSSALFVILAHDRPFVGNLGVKPTPIEQAIARIERSYANQSAGSAPDADAVQTH